MSIWIYILHVCLENETLKRGLKMSAGQVYGEAGIHLDC